MPTQRSSELGPGTDLFKEQAYEDLSPYQQDAEIDLAHDMAIEHKRVIKIRQEAAATALKAYDLLKLQQTYQLDANMDPNPTRKVLRDQGKILEGLNNSTKDHKPTKGESAAEQLAVENKDSFDDFLYWRVGQMKDRDGQLTLLADTTDPAEKKKIKGRIRTINKLIDMSDKKYTELSHQSSLDYIRALTDEYLVEEIKLAEKDIDQAKRKIRNANPLDTCESQYTTIAKNEFWLKNAKKEAESRAAKKDLTMPEFMGDTE